jgi:uncharacterized membrane protein YwaF
MWITLKNWLIGNMGTGGDFAYQAMHLYSMLGVCIAMGILLFLGLRFRENQKASRNLVLSVAWFQLGFELLWRVLYLALRGDSLLTWWPLFPCNLGGILLPLFVIFNLHRGKQMFYLFGFVGGCLTFAIPNGIFCNTVLVFPILKSILQHTGLLLIPMLELVSGEYRPKLKDMGWVSLGCIAHIFNSEAITRLLGFTGDYMFFRSGLPFVIPGVPQYITLSVFAMLVLAVLSFLCDVKGSVRLLHRK